MTDQIDDEYYPPDHPFWQQAKEKCAADWQAAIARGVLHENTVHAMAHQHDILLYMVEHTNLLVDITTHYGFDRSSKDIAWEIDYILCLIFEHQHPRVSDWARHRPDLVARMFAIYIARDEVDDSRYVYRNMCTLAAFLDDSAENMAMTWAAETLSAFAMRASRTFVHWIGVVAAISVLLRWPHTIVASDGPRIANLRAIAEYFRCRTSTHPMSMCWGRAEEQMLRFEHLLYYADVLRIGLALQPAELSVLQLMAIVDASHPNGLPLHVKWRAVELVKHGVK